MYDGDRPLTLTRTEHGFTGEFDLDRGAALVDVVAGPFTCEATGLTFAARADRTAIQLTRGRTTDLKLTYVPGQSAIRVTPRLSENGGPGRPVPGVRFRLYVGSPEDGVPITRVTTATNPTVSFADLPPGEVTLLVDPPARFGEAPIELRAARNASLRINLGAGQDLVLDERYEFAPAAGDVTVTVVEDADDRNRLPRVPVRLSRLDNGADGNPYEELTDHKGVAHFADIPPGTYRVELAVNPLMADGRTWTTAGPARAVVVTADGSRGSVELRLVEDLHIVRGTVFGPGGAAAAHALVEIRTAPDDDRPFDTVLADAAGRYEWEAPNAGQFFLTTARQDGQLRRVLPVSVNSVAHLDIHTDNGFAGNPGPSGPGTTTTTTGDDPTPFPLLVGNVDLTTGTAPGGHRGGGGGYGGEHSAGDTVSAAIRDVLGYRTKSTDTRGFVAALARSFSCHDKSGYTVCEWTPRSYAATIPADLGALTGAQASIFERAKVSADSIIPLLDGLTPLLSDADREDVDAIRRIVRSRITEIVTELSLEGGPRTQRVDELFERLTGLVLDNDPDTFVVLSADDVAGELGVLRERFGFLRGRINLISEEEDFTNFLIIVDSVGSLFVTWQQVRDLFRRGAGQQPGNADAPFLGTQLVLISRQLGVITETIRETYFAMDSVFLGPAERQTVLLPLVDEGAAPTTILLSELLDWIDRFVTEEGPRLIEDGGTDGVNAFEPTVRRLATLALSAAGLRQAQNPTIPPTFFTTRVRLALQQLAGQLAGARDLADAVFERLNLGDPPDIPPGKGKKHRSSTQGGRS